MLISSIFERKSSTDITVLYSKPAGAAGAVLVSCDSSHFGSSSMRPRRRLQQIADASFPYSVFVRQTSSQAWTGSMPQPFSTTHCKSFKAHWTSNGFLVLALKGLSREIF
jgi:hypothetical protein